MREMLQIHPQIETFYHLSPDSYVPLLFVLPLPLRSVVGESLVHVALPHAGAAPLVLVVWSPPAPVRFKGSVSSALGLTR